jgi:hypothetical protein
MTWNPFKPFVRSRAEVAEWMQRALSGNLDCRDWDTFVRVPIKGDPQMDAIRAQCEALLPLETTGADGMLSHTPEARAKLQQLVERLRNDV